MDPKALRERGNKCMNRRQYKEAIENYTEALKIEPNNEIVYNNRSLAYYKLRDYKLALKDADEAVEIKPFWAKALFRKAEAEFALESYNEAMDTYEKALELLPDNPKIHKALFRVHDAQLRKIDYDSKIPWMCSCVGLILGIAFTIIDYILSENHSSENPLMQIFFIHSLSGSFYMCSRIFLSKYNPFSFSNKNNKIRLWIFVGFTFGCGLVLMDKTMYNSINFRNTTEQAFIIATTSGIGFTAGIYLQYQYEVETQDNEQEREIIFRNMAKQFRKRSNDANRQNGNDDITKIAI